MDEIIYCKKCHQKKRSIAYENALLEMEKNGIENKIVDKCTSSCGLGKKKYFATKDEELMVFDTLAELIKELRE